MSNQLKPTDQQSQDITKQTDFASDNDCKIWLTVSIHNKTLKKIEVAELCSTDYPKRSKESWRQWYYDQPKEFENWWLDQYRAHYKRTVGAKVYSKLDSLIDNARDISSVIEAGQFVEGTQKGPNVAVQVNNDLSGIEFVQDDS